jgi:uncharacterized protein YjbI with pentapeptide repeats
MQRDNPFRELPIEILQVIMSQGDVVATITNFMQTSKDNAKRLTILLRNPDFLLSLLCELPSAEMGKLLQSFYLPESENYKAIEEKSLLKDRSAMICFCFMTNDVNLINWEDFHITPEKQKPQKRSAQTPENVNLQQKSENNSGIQNKKPQTVFEHLNNKDISPSTAQNNKLKKLENRIFQMQMLIKDRMYHHFFSKEREEKLSEEYYHGFINLSKGYLFAVQFPREKDLSWSNFSNADLRRAFMFGMNLSHANFRGSNLSKSCLQNSNLSEADLRGANLSDANLYCVKLDGANLDGATFSKEKPGLGMADFIRTDVSPDEFEQALNRLHSFKMSNEESYHVVHEAVLKQILSEVKDESMLQIAYNHPYFSSPTYETKDSEGVNINANIKMNLFLSKLEPGRLIETESQKQITDKIAVLKRLAQRRI